MKTENNFTFGNMFILGSSGFAREVSAYLRSFFPGNIILVDDNGGKDTISVKEYQEKTKDDHRAASILGSGRPEIKKKMLSQLNTQLLNVIHPRATVSTFSSIGKGCVLAPGAVISPSVSIGNHVLVNYNASIGHDSIIDDLAVVSPNAAIGGWVHVGEGAYIGAGAYLHERIKIGKWSVIGMGAVVLKDVPPEHIAVGVPARLSTLEEWNSRKENKNGNGRTDQETRGDSPGGDEAAS